MVVTRLILFLCLAMTASCFFHKNPGRPKPKSKDYRAGYTEISNSMSENSFTGRVWYPISLSEEVSPIPTGPMFHEFIGKKDAKIVSEPNKFPLLILSHGSGSLAKRLDWMAHYFAERGWIVAGINHPGNTVGDNSAEGLMQVWKRPVQITKFLDWFLKNHPFASRIDLKTIVIAGHSAGGTTALLLAGARLSKDNLQNPVPNCILKPPELDDEKCSDLRKIDPKKYDRDEVEKDYSDPRIKAVIAMDPGFNKSFEHHQEENIHISILLILAEKLKSPEGEIYAHELVSIFPMADQYIVPGSIHISFITPCNQLGLTRQIPICTGDNNRENIQALINEKAFNFATKKIN